MINNPLQFAVVREDPRIEEALLEGLGPTPRALLIGSGGCTALHLQSISSGIDVTVLDPNPAQLDLIRRKSEFLVQGRASDTRALIEGGNFEALFRRLREFLWDMVADREAWLRVFTEAADPAPFFKHKFWMPAFELHFHDSVLNAMFGPDATQHAPKGSYPIHFERVLREGLLRSDRAANYFLHHIFLGRYLEGTEPVYLRTSPTAFRPLKMIQGTLLDVPDFSTYDLISLSNVFDWMDDAAIDRTARKILSTARKGARIVIRQLNHSKDFTSTFRSGFEFDQALADRLHAADRSLFYSRLLIGTRKA